MRDDDLYSLPEGLPVPIDDGGCDHLPGRAMPPVALPATYGSTVRLDEPVPGPVLSDEGLALTRVLDLPTFEHAGLTLLKRHTLVIRAATIEHVFYPVFPSDCDAAQVLDWLRG